MSEKLKVFKNIKNNEVITSSNILMTTDDSQAVVKEMMIKCKSTSYPISAKVMLDGIPLMSADSQAGEALEINYNGSLIVDTESPFSLHAWSTVSLLYGCSPVCVLI